jgi:hypothetical protein
MERSVTVLRVILVATVVSSIVHYTDNYVRFDQYPQDEPKLVTKALIWQSWIVFTAFAVTGYAAYRRAQWGRAAVCLAVYSLSGLISPLHYLSGALSEFDALQHTFILTDAVCGAAVLAFAGWVVASVRTPTQGADRARAG